MFRIIRIYVVNTLDVTMWFILDLFKLPDDQIFEPKFWNISKNVCYVNDLSNYML